MYVFFSSSAHSTIFVQRVRWTLKNGLKNVLVCMWYTSAAVTIDFEWKGISKWLHYCTVLYTFSWISLGFIHWLWTKMYVATSHKLCIFVWFHRRPLFAMTWFGFNLISISYFWNVQQSGKRVRKHMSVWFHFHAKNVKYRN